MVIFLLLHITQSAVKVQGLCGSPVLCDSEKSQNIVKNTTVLVLKLFGDTALSLLVLCHLVRSKSLRVNFCIKYMNKDHVMEGFSQLTLKGCSSHSDLGF